MLSNGDNCCSVKGLALAAILSSIHPSWALHLLDHSGVTSDDGRDLDEGDWLELAGGLDSRWFDINDGMVLSD